MRLGLLLLCLTCACRDLSDDAGDTPDAAVAAAADASLRDAPPGAADARPADARLVDATPGAPTVPAIGRAATIDILCWNIRQFPSTGTTVQSVAAVLTALDVDVVAVAEIREDAAWADLLSRLPDWQGFLGKGDGYIKMGLLWRPARVNVGGVTTLFDGDYDFPRPPIVATVTHGAASMTLINVHLKAGRNAGDAERRANSNDKLQAYLSGRGNSESLICGDFNEDLDNNYAAEVYAPWLAAPQTYRILTSSLDHAGTATYLPGRIMFDQMISTASLDGELGSEKPFIPALDKQFKDYEDELSDHLPVAIRVDLH